jgi:hypothetical protein
LGKFGKRVISTIMAALMLVALFPPLAQDVQAAVTMVITKPAATNTTQSNPANVTSKQIDIEFQFTDISDAEMSKLLYRITNLTTGASQLISDNPAQKLGTGQAIFQNVDLSEGINRIAVVLDTGSKPESLPVYVNYSAVTTISNLKIDGRAFSSGMIVPNNNSMATGLGMMFVEGFAPNATEVIGYSTKTPAGDRSDFLLPLTGQFSFSSGHDQLAELKLRPGDNDMTIVASNAFKTYRADRQFVYNSGEAFLYNTVIQSVYNANTTLPPLNDRWLYKQPTIQGATATGPFGFNIRTDIKINRDLLGFTHDGLTLQVNGGTSAIVVDIDTSVPANSATVNVTVSSNAIPTASYTLETYPDYFVIKNVLIQGILLDSNSPAQVLNATFSPLGTNQPQTQAFNYQFVNEKQPFIKSVKMVNGLELYSGIEISILTSAFDLTIDTDNGVSGVNVYLPSDGTGVPIATTTTSTPTVPTGDSFSLSLNKNLLPEGQSILRFVPFTGVGGPENLLGAREYLINYNPSPYVYLTNIVNGNTYTDSVNHPSLILSNGTAVNGPVLQIKPVNIPESQFGDIRIKWNDQYDKLRIVDTDFGTRPNYSSEGYTVTGDVVRDTLTTAFVEFRFEFGQANTHVNRRNWKWSEGLNNLVIEVYANGALDANGAPQNGAVPITTMKYELFHFTDALPEVTKLDLTDAIKGTDDFTSVEGQNFRYYTQQTSMQFTASFKETNFLEVRVNTLDVNGSPTQRIGKLIWNGSTFTESGTDSQAGVIGAISAVTGATLPLDNGNATLTSLTVNLFGSGTNTVEIIATNKAGNFATKVMEIVREPATFIMHYPQIDQNPVTKEWVGRINGNYTRIYVEAEGADKIIYGKNQEVSRTTTMQLGSMSRDVYIFEVKGLKKGNNKVEFTAVRGTRSDKISVTLVNADTAVPGAEFKESISKASIKAFNSQLQLSFPKGTVLKRNNASAADQYLAPSRDLLIAIADSNNGRVNKYIHPAGSETSTFPRNGQWESNFVRIQNINSRYRKVSPLYWIDGGYIPLTGSPTEQDVLYGSGIYPYEMGKEFYMRNALNVNDQFVPSQPGKLTLSYDPNMVSSSWRYVTVYHYGYNENFMGLRQFEWKNIGGTVDPKKNTITVPIQEFGYYIVMYMDQSFDDIIGHPWARDYMDTLFSKGVMNNKEVNRFETNEPITRGEFISLIVKAQDLPLNYEGTGTFSDVTRANPLSFGLYEYKYIETAARAGIARGTLQRRFMPANSISREDAASLLARALELNVTGTDARVNASLGKSFTDLSNIGQYARASVEAVVKAKLMEGKQNITNAGSKPTYYFDPKANLTRAEASVIIMKMLLSEKRVPSL